MKRLIFLISFLGILVGPMLGGAEVVDRVVAVVGSEIITLSDVKQFTAQRSANPRLAEMLPGNPGAKNPQAPLEALIREKLLKQEMERLGVSASEQDIEAAVNDVISRNRITVDALKAELAKKGSTLEKYKKDLGDQIRQMRFLSQVIFPRIKITEEEIAQKVGANPSDQTRVRARMELLQARSSEELVKYLDEARTKTYVEIKP